MVPFLYVMVKQFKIERRLFKFTSIFFILFKRFRSG